MTLIAQLVTEISTIFVLFKFTVIRAIDVNLVGFQWFAIASTLVAKWMCEPSFNKTSQYLLELWLGGQTNWQPSVEQTNKQTFKSSVIKYIFHKRAFIYLFILSWFYYI